ncbi:hypothetical protein PIB30_056176 [Stylosanthes scabra]|uniref:Uncharacterized protein n=1 Tax=Stylosanthes scabra TaxID=79078 RepID=A0ABU6SK74_9FABA|nr:hypothetical protein [Stylosanthes scabra]
MEAFVVSLRPFQGRPSRHREEEETPPAPFPATTTVAGKWSSSPPPFYFFCGSISLNIAWFCLSALSAAILPPSSPPPFCLRHLRRPATGVLAAAVKGPLQPPQEGERNNKTELRSARYRCGFLASKALLE